MAKIAVIVGSESDVKKVQQSVMLELFRAVGVSFELSVISAHRNPRELADYCQQVLKRGARVFIGIAGMAAVLPGVIAAQLGTVVAQCPVIGVALPSAEFPNALDALLAMVRMPSGVPVLVAGMGDAGLANAAHAACQLVAIGDEPVEQSLAAYMVTRRKPVQIGLETFEGRSQQ